TSRRRRRSSSRHSRGRPCNPNQRCRPRWRHDLHFTNNQIGPVRGGRSVPAVDSHLGDADLNTSTFADALVSDAVHPAIPSSQRLFEPLLGSWHLEVKWFDESGQLVRRQDGEWHFSRVLEGRAIQDVWIVPSRGQRGQDDYEYGTSIRF